MSDTPDENAGDLGKVLRATVEELGIILQNFAAVLKADAEDRAWVEEGLSPVSIVHGRLNGLELRIQLADAALDALNGLRVATSKADPSASGMLPFAALLEAADLGPLDLEANEKLGGLLELGGMLVHLADGQRREIEARRLRFDAEAAE